MNALKAFAAVFVGGALFAAGFNLGAQVEGYLYVSIVAAWQQNQEIKAARCHTGPDGLEHCHQ